MTNTLQIPLKDEILFPNEFKNPVKNKQIVKIARQLSEPFRVDKGHGFRLKDVDPGDTLGYGEEAKPRAEKALAMGLEFLGQLQDQLYAHNKWALLLIFQAMDAAGKDGAIKHVMSGANPQGCQVFSFKAPSPEELDHDYLWRCLKVLPSRGHIGIFNRSYYEDVQAKERDAQVVLAESIGITPTAPLQVVDFSRLAVPTNLEDTVERLIDRTLEQRPDLLAQVASLREKEANIRRARAAYYPTLAFEGDAGGSADRSQMKFAGNTLPWSSTQQPVWGVGLSLTWELFDGGARKRKLEMAKAEREAAQHELIDSRDKAISQVWQSYTDTKMAIRRLDVAVALVDASEKSYQQTFESYQNGLSSLVDVLTARRELSQARYMQLDTRATLLESTAALAFASGDLGPQLLKRQSGNKNTEP